MKWVLGICAIILAAGIALVCIYLGKQWNRTTFFEKTTIDGFDVADQTPEEVLPVLKEAFTAAKVSLTENDREQASWSLEDLGYTIDEDALLKGLEEALGRQKSSIPVLIDSMMNGNAYEIDVPFRHDQEKLASAVTVASLADERVANVNARIKYRKKKNKYVIIPEVQGTELRDPDIQHLVQSTVDDVIGGTEPEKDLVIAIPQQLYVQPAILSTDSELNLKVNTYNSYCKAVVTHVFGDQTERIDWETIQNWVVFENGQGYLSEEKLREYVMQLGQKYNTIYYNRTFHTSTGADIKFGESENNYGYLIDEEGEYTQLLADIQANTETEREPVYLYSGIDRSGTDDMRTYVEVSISAQHLWFYASRSFGRSTSLRSSISACILSISPWVSLSPIVIIPPFINITK